MSLPKITLPDDSDVLSQLLTSTASREQVLRDALPDFLLQQRWFGAKGQQIAGISFEQVSIWQVAQHTWLLTLISVKLAQGDTHTYFFPLAFAASDSASTVPSSAILAELSAGTRSGILYDALAAPAFSHALVDLIGAHSRINFGTGTIQGIPSSMFTKLRGTAPLSKVKNPKVSGSNTAFLLDDRLFLKIYRRLHVGMNPEVEIGRFLTDASPYDHIVPVAGYLQFQDGERQMAAGVLQGCVTHQGDAWNYTLEHLQEHLEENVDAAKEDAFLNSISTLGRRTAELHVALCQHTGDSAFDPEPVSAADIAAWKAQVRQDTEHTFSLLARKAASLPAAASAQAAQLLTQRDNLLEPILQALPEAITAMKTRYHGDYHLGQVLISAGDFILIDFEGEPTRSLQERRTKHSPLRDVAGMLRSFSYAAAVALDVCVQRNPARQAQLAQQSQAWELQTVTAFLTGYGKASAQMRCLPSEAQQTQILITLFSLEKALYELRYELDNRPDWVGVPLSGLLQLIPA